MKDEKVAKLKVKKEGEAPIDMYLRLEIAQKYITKS